MLRYSKNLHTVALNEAVHCNGVAPSTLPTLNQDQRDHPRLSRLHLLFYIGGDLRIDEVRESRNVACVRRLNQDLAVVAVEISTPKVTRALQRVRVTGGQKLAFVGK